MTPSPKKKRPTTLHDTFFRLILSYEDLCQAFLQMALSKQEMKLFNLKHLKKEQGIFIDQNLKEHRTDIVVSLPLKRPRKNGKRLKVYFLVEHKSYYNPPILVQMLKYQTEIYESAGIPVYSIVVYHGKTPWDFSGNFQDIQLQEFTSKERRTLKRKFIDFTCTWIDLQKLKFKRFKKLTNHPALSLALFVMKNIRSLNDKLVEKFFVKSKDLVKKYPKLVYGTLTYIARNDKRYAKKEKLLELENNVLKEEEKFMKNDLLLSTFPWQDEEIEAMGQEKLQEGRQEGRQEGLQEGRKEVAIRMLRKGIELQQIHEFTQLPMKKIKQLAKGM